MSLVPRRQAFLALGWIGVVGLMAACGDSDPQAPGGGDPATLAIVSGNNQTGAPGAALGSALTVRVTDAGGASVSGATVQWAVTGGGGSVNPTSSSTAASGNASTTLTLGSAQGPNTATASVTGLTAVTFTATASTTGPPPPLPPPPSASSVSIGDNFFNPAIDTIAVAGTVTWNWNGGNQHRVEFDDNSIGNSPQQSSGSFNKAFANAGTFTYFCSVHGRAVMSGEVRVIP